MDEVLNSKQHFKINLDRHIATVRVKKILIIKDRIEQTRRTAFIDIPNDKNNNNNKNTHQNNTTNQQQT